MPRLVRSNGRDSPSASPFSSGGELGEREKGGIGLFGISRWVARALAGGSIELELRVSLPSLAFPPAGGREESPTPRRVG